MAEAHSARALSEHRTLPEGETATSQYEIMLTRNKE